MNNDTGNDDDGFSKFFLICGEVLNKDAPRKKIYLRGNHSCFTNKKICNENNSFSWKWKKFNDGSIAKTLNNSFTNVIKLLDVSQNDCQAFVNEVRMQLVLNALKAIQKVSL